MTNPHPSALAMSAAVDLEAHACLGRVQTVVIGRIIQGVLDAERERCAKIADAEADEARALFAAEKCSEYATGILIAVGIAKEIRKPT